MQKSERNGWSVKSHFSVEVLGEVIDIGAGRSFTAKDPEGHYIQVFGSALSNNNQGRISMRKVMVSMMGTRDGNQLLDRSHEREAYSL